MAKSIFDADTPEGQRLKDYYRTLEGAIREKMRLALMKFFPEAVDIAFRQNLHTDETDIVLRMKDGTTWTLGPTGQLLPDTGEHI
jgi:hypothetical protein